ncbi:unnamed protein product [marine sediment metagenome]|uniref:Uncharacterized protein n=1 Tax=marine sediment metagenome TaxID=412755 RepID=X1LGI0_9ZZZZ
MAGQASQTYLLGFYHYIIYFESYFVATSKVTGVGDRDADAYAFPDIDLSRRYSQVAGSKNSRTSVSDDSEGGKVTYRSADSMCYRVNSGNQINPFTCLLIKRSDDQILLSNALRYIIRVISDVDGYWWVKCGSVWPKVINSTEDDTRWQRPPDYHRDYDYPG